MKKFAKVLLGTVCAVSMLSCAACGGGGGESAPGSLGTGIQSRVYRRVQTRRGGVHPPGG